MPTFKTIIHDDSHQTQPQKTVKSPTLIAKAAQQEMRELHQSLCISAQEPVYLCDGVWLYPDGKLEER